MRDPLSLKAHEILAISLNTPGFLFGDADLDEVKRALTKMWHPDRNKDPNAEEVMRHVALLLKAAREQQEKGTYSLPGMLRLQAESLVGKQTVEFRYKDHFDTLPGHCYWGETTVLYTMEHVLAPLIMLAGQAVIRNTWNHPSKLTKDFQKYLPDVIRPIDTSNTNALAIRKTPEVIPLRRVYDYYRSEGGIPARHIAWMMSSLLNTCCFLEHTGTAHMGLCVDHLWVSPEHHSILVLGGWQYAGPVGVAHPAMMRRCFPYLTPEVRKSSRTDVRSMLNLVRAVGRDLLGDISGISLMTMHEAKCPGAMLEFFTDSPKATAIEDYTEWGRVLDRAFGPRKFLPMIIDKDRMSKLHQQ